MTANLLFPHQLFRESPLLRKGEPIILAEEFLFFRQYRFHRQKLAFHRAAMKAYARYLEDSGMKVRYLDCSDPSSDVRELIPHLALEGFVNLRFMDPSDDWLEQRITNTARRHGMHWEKLPSPLFLNSLEEIEPFFTSGRNKFSQTEFYIRQRKQRDILLEQGKPAGGKWSFDAENRKRYPKNKVPPPVIYPGYNSYHEEAVAYVAKHFPSNPGALEGHPLFPSDHAGAQAWLHQFLETRFAGFGPYEDAIVAGQSVLHHSVLTPLLNVGLLTPAEVVDGALRHASENPVPLNSLEGFIRQVVGWREFIRGMYEFHGGRERTANFWGFERKVPRSFYDATTGIAPVDITIRKVLKTGYAHHIERLMVLGNFMLLCEFDPDEVYRWFMELFIDAYDWVMVPNVYGMSQFADGGMMATKPYISGSNYLMKMGDYPKGAWQEVWDALFWRFMHVHRDFFLQNPRLGMLVRTFDKMPNEKQDDHLQVANAYLQILSG